MSMFCNFFHNFDKTRAFHENQSFSTSLIGNIPKSRLSEFMVFVNFLLGVEAKDHYSSKNLRWFKVYIR